MTAPIAVRPDPTDLPPPHGPDHELCGPCDRLRRAIGHRAITPSLRETLRGLYLDYAEAGRSIGLDALADHCELRAAALGYGGDVIDWSDTP